MAYGRPKLRQHEEKQPRGKLLVSSRKDKLGTRGRKNVLFYEALMRIVDKDDHKKYRELTVRLLEELRDSKAFTHFALKSVPAINVHGSLRFFLLNVLNDEALKTFKADELMDHAQQTLKAIHALQKILKKTKTAHIYVDPWQSEPDASLAEFDKTRYVLHQKVFAMRSPARSSNTLAELVGFWLRVFEISIGNLNRAAIKVKDSSLTTNKISVKFKSAKSRLVVHAAHHNQKILGEFYPKFIADVMNTSTISSRFSLKEPITKKAVQQIINTAQKNRILG